MEITAGKPLRIDESNKEVMWYVALNGLLTFALSGLHGDLVEVLKAGK